jgi:dTDP-4-dehydrorhamnose reductase
LKNVFEERKAFKMNRILILGASGLVGKALSKELNEKYEVYGTYNSNKIAAKKSIHFNISETNKIIDILNKVKPLKIVYCLRGDFNCQKELLNKMIKYLKYTDIKLYFCSNRSAFDSDTIQPNLKDQKEIVESDYDKFEIECEELLKKDLGNNGVILKLPMMRDKNSSRLNSIITVISSNEKIDVLKNLYPNSSAVEMLAKQISYIIENDFKGVFHLGSNEGINYYEVAKKIITNLRDKSASLMKKSLQQKNTISQFYLMSKSHLKNLIFRKKI